MKLTRRSFLGTSAAAVMAAGTMSRSTVIGANDRIGVCVVGVNGQGNTHIRSYMNSPDSELVAICDADERVLNGRRDQIKNDHDHDLKTYVDIRDALADDDIDVISIASPNHWHALSAIWACQAGKDVYVEKPASHNVFEGRQLIAAAEQYGQIIQHGTQSRSDKRWMRDIKLLQSGEIIGPLHTARALGYKHGRRDSIGFAEPESPPDGLHWRLWQGPASEQPYISLYHPYNWHWFWHYGNGEIGNQGVHQMDIAAWGMNKGLPVSVHSAGGRYTYEDQAETPNTNVATFTFADGTMMVFDVRNRFTNDESGVRVGNLFYGSDGYYVQDKGFFDAADNPIELDESEYPYPESNGAFQNFLDAVKSRNPAEIQGNMEDAHVSNTCCHLANISYRLKRSLQFDPEQETFVDASDADALLTREYHPDFEVPKLA